MDDSISTFARAAREYCALVERESSGTSWEFAADCLASLLRLHLHALALPNAKPSTDEVLDRVDDIAREQVLKNLTRLKRDLYWSVFEPIEGEKPEPGVGSLSDDLADIWRDVKPGLLAIENGGSGALDGAVWHWRFSFETHWGRHSAEAISGLHALCFGAFADATRPSYR